eukprot:CAMPEP_0174946662 /NCGR_PEP_ID=MMETSP1355-20121228/84704_1 /TAXON_ID=464990 /ORGANISM="Hemiselmis tepida, Strain CCMP443" /LENGTH=53 /DNA_ID=CAMNT_0016194095 /DNA_START=75 /DNA_END=233 /DNA_ORIENTATION=-
MDKTWSQKGCDMLVPKAVNIIIRSRDAASVVPQDKPTTIMDMAAQNLRSKTTS